MDYVQIKLHTILILVLGLLFIPKTNVGASTQAKISPKTATDITQNLPEKDLEQQISDLYTQGIVAASIDSLSDKAIELFESVLDLDSTHSPTLYELATYNSNKDKNKAISYINRAIAADSISLEYKRELARIYILDRQYAAATKVFEELKTLDPNNQINYHILSSLYIETKMPFAALTILDSAQNRFGKASEISVTKRDLLASLNMFDKATEQAQSIAIDYPSDVDNQLVLAELYGVQNKDSLAIQAYNQAKKLDSDNINVLLSMCDYYAKIKNNRAFLSTAFEIIKSKNLELDYKIDFFNTHIKKKELYQSNYFQVNDIAANFAILYPNDLRAIALYSSHLLSSGKGEQAAQIYKDRLEGDAKNIELYNNIIDIEGYLNRADSVEKYSTLALELDPKNIDLHLRRSGVLQFLKRFDEAS